jgi:hypothetical protein
MSYAVPPLRPVGSAVALLLRVQTTNPLNSRKHWRSVWRQGEREKEIVAIRFLLHRLAGGALPRLPVDVRLVRISPHHTEMDEDGCAASLKHVRDQVAIELGAFKLDKDGAKVALDGRHDLITFKIAQERGETHRVRVEIAPRTGEAP